MTNTEIKTKNQPKKKAANIQVDKLRTFEGHPFKVLDDEDMGNLIESIRQQGIIFPLIVRAIESTDEYEVISGHRRLHAAVKAGLSEVPALIYPLDRSEATIHLGLHSCGRLPTVLRQTLSCPVIPTVRGDITSPIRKVRRTLC